MEIHATSSMPLPLSLARCYRDRRILITGGLGFIGSMASS